MLKELEAEWRSSQKYISKKELLEIFPEAIPYLEGERKTAKTMAEAFETIVKWQIDEIYEKYEGFSRWFWLEVLKIMDGAILDKYENRIKEINLFFAPERKGGITDADIERAREYPFNQLIKVNRSGFAICPFHEETNPSFHIKNNFYFCFSCLEKGDTIDFVMKTENISFIEAVKRLS